MSGRERQIQRQPVGVIGRLLRAAEELQSAGEATCFRGFGSESGNCIVVAIRGLRHSRYSAQLMYAAAVAGDT